MVEIFTGKKRLYDYIITWVSVCTNITVIVVFCLPTLIKRLLAVVEEARSLPMHVLHPPSLDVAP